MTKSSNDIRIERIIASAEKLFGEKVVRLTAPGGKGRASYRLFLSDRSVVATLRHNFRRTHLEAFTLRQLTMYCDDLPTCLGVDGEIMFQSDVGGRRLNVAIAEAAPEDRQKMAHDAVSAIFRIQAAGRSAGLHDALPHLGQNRKWLENFVFATDVFEKLSLDPPVGLDPDALCELIDQPGTQFVKWDCRSGNAAIASDDRLRWFDFEYSGVRHGAEDFAWLIGDEAWPLPPEDMDAIMRDAFHPGYGKTADAFMDYLALYTTFHCLQRLKLIIKEAQKRGWLSKARVRKYDDAGVHPEFALHLCRVGAYFADRNVQTRALVPCYEAAAQTFSNIFLEGLKQAKGEADAA